MTPFILNCIRIIDRSMYYGQLPLSERGYCCYWRRWRRRRLFTNRAIIMFWLKIQPLSRKTTVVYYYKNLCVTHQYNLAFLLPYQRRWKDGGYEEKTQLLSELHFANTHKAAKFYGVISGIKMFPWIHVINLRKNRHPVNMVFGVQALQFRRISHERFICEFHVGYT